MNQEKNKMNQDKETKIKSTSIVIKNIEVNDPEFVSNEIQKINQRAEEVCPTHEISNEEHLDSIGIKSTINHHEQLGIDVETILTYAQNIRELRQKNEIAISALKFALGFIIHDNLRLHFEYTLKELKK